MRAIPPAPLTAVVLTHHDERSLLHCLASVATWVQEIVVVDVWRTNQTRDIAKAYGARIVEYPFETHVPQWFWAVEHLSLQHDWVFCLEADQRVTPALAAELHQLFTVEPSALAQVNGFYIKRRQVFRGKWMRYGGAYRDDRLALFRRSRATISPDDWVAPHIEVEGPVGTLQHDLIEDIGQETHLSHWIEKCTHAAALKAVEELYDRDRSHHGPKHAVLRGHPEQRTCWRQQVWYRLPLFVRPFIFLVYRYVLRLGFLDGKEGLIFHFLQAFWFRLLVDIKLDELRRHVKE